LKNAIRALAAERRTAVLAPTSWLMLAVALSACGGGSSSVPGPTPTLQLTASATATVAGGQDVALHAELVGSTELPTWQLSGPGSLSATTGTDVRYVPPSTEGLDDPGSATISVATATLAAKQATIAVAAVDRPGHHWSTALVMADRLDFVGLQFGGGAYVSRGSANLILRSVDGIAWTQVPVGPAGETLEAVVWTGSAWIATSSMQHHYSSPDALAWTATDAVPPDTFGFTQVYAGNGVLVAEINGEVRTSQDAGTSWSTPSGIGNVLGLGFAGGLFMGVSDDTVWTSADGLAWSAAASPFGPEPVYGFTGTGAHFFESYDDSLAVFTAPSTWQRVVFDEVRSVPTWIADGAAGYVGVNADGWAMRSSDGLAWTVAREASHGAFMSVDDVDGTWVTLTDAGWAYASLDLQNWTSSPLPRPYPDLPAFLLQPTSLAHGNGVVVATARIANAPSNRPDSMVLVSHDGLDWHFAAAPPVPDRNAFPVATLGQVLFDGHRFLTVTGRDIYASADGETWTRLGSTPPAWGLRTLAFNGSLYVAAGDFGVAARSTDGATWSVLPANPPIPGGFGGAGADIHALAWDGHQFVAFGSNAVVATSTDGLSWDSRSQSEVDAQAAALCGGVLYAAGNQGILSSLDGRTWFRHDATPRVGIGCDDLHVVATDVSIMVSDH
jgi:hypothetical protein